ncbi:MAG: metallophosphoesterase [Proteobacteria bacterium]|nr:metallophosphoesterase [Pseudomonadota bacterium]
MKIVITSDTHFGDPMGRLVEKNADANLVKGSKYAAFKEAAGTGNDYLILLGDVLDFSISTYQEAFETARVFFNEIKNDKIANEIIYAPGNHDADLWHTVEYQANIINQIEKGNPPRPFHLSLPGIIDDRKDSPSAGFTLPGVTKQTSGGGAQYAGLFLDHITNPSTPFNFVYPNIYMVTDQESVLMTHGQYLSPYWSLGSEWAPRIATEEDLRIGDALDLAEMVGMNFPLSQLACSGIGQAGPLTRVARLVQRDIKDRKMGRIEKYLDRLEATVDEMTRYPWYKQWMEWLTDKASEAIKKLVLHVFENMEEARFNEEFIYKKEVRERFDRFYQASLNEIGLLNRNYHYDLTTPKFVIFGHTHEPTAWGDPTAPWTKPATGGGLTPVTLYNTGGWLDKLDENGRRVFCGAEVFLYQTSRGFSSVRVS